ncbi:hypothetical protein [Nostoc sp. UCD121]|nr:hypothetical protein [Nostoc sp. UCD121]
MDKEWGMGRNAQFPDALIIGKKRGKLLTASIIEFDLLFNAQAYK